MQNTETTLEIGSLAAEAGADWQTARRFVHTATRFEHGAVACRVMAGLVLLELKRELGISAGTRTDLPARAERLGQTEPATRVGGSWVPHDAGMSWGARVQAELGISDETASRWMKMASAALPRLKSGDVGAVFRQLLEVPITSLTEAQSKTLAAGVERLVDGRSQLDFMESLGLLAPLPPKGGDRMWRAFLEAKHPELIVEGKVPSRGKVSKAVKTEFDAWLAKKVKPSTAAEKQAAARALLRAVEDVVGAAIRNPVLAVLEPTEFVTAEAMARQWVERLKGLSARK